MLFSVSSGIVVLGIVIYVIHQGYVNEPVKFSKLSESSMNRVHLPSPLTFMSNEHNSSLLWGTYRSGMYLGIRSRTLVEYIAAGLMWKGNSKSMNQMRHLCQQDDELNRFGWLKHDGRSFGYQEILDQHNDIELGTSFLRLDGDNATYSSMEDQMAHSSWMVRIDTKKYNAKKQEEVSLFFYISHSCEGIEEKQCFSELSGMNVEKYSSNQGEFNSTTTLRVQGKSQKWGHFQLDMISPNEKNVAKLYFQGFQNVDVSDLQQHLINEAKGSTNFLLNDVVDEKSTIVVLQAVVPIGESIDFIYTGKDYDAILESSSWNQNLGTQMIQEKMQSFDQKFEEIFQLSQKGIDGILFHKKEIDFAAAAISNMLGGIGFTSGSLFSAVPSRSFFPRGFLWDEGFHLLLLSHWDTGLSQDIIGHWLSSVHEGDLYGWIAREQLLGKEALQRVPQEFVVQHTEHANPPTLLLALDKLCSSLPNEVKKTVLTAFFPRLQAWYDWFLRTQNGKLAGSFRWRGRNPREGKVNPNTLASGLDDYPRASEPSDAEYHVDLLCWMIKASDIMTKISSFLGVESKRFHANENKFREMLEKIHLDNESGLFYDVGDHSTDGSFQVFVHVHCASADNRRKKLVFASLQQLQERTFQCPRDFPQFLYPLGDGHGGVLMREQYIPRTIKHQFVKHIGYLNLFPMLFKLLPHDSIHLEKILDILSNPKLLWSPYGIRSLATIDEMYERPNAAGDNPYWRGSIWININYLTVSALHHYGGLKGPFQTRIQKLYTQLRKALISNIFSEYQRTGYLWEQYSGDIHSKIQGQGQRCHPFSGWTALIVKIMAEKY